MTTTDDPWAGNPFNDVAGPNFSDMTAGDLGRYLYRNLDDLKGARVVVVTDDGRHTVFDGTIMNYSDGTELTLWGRREEKES